jgi:hypothetical protein
MLITRATSQRLLKFQKLTPVLTRSIETEIKSASGIANVEGNIGSKKDQQKKKDKT